jgi:hypothetical protein
MNAICERSAIIETVLPRPGFGKVALVIARDLQSSLSAPEAAWFQLLVGYLAAAAGEEIAFETAIAGSAPKDVVMRSGAVQIECKAFLMATDLIEIWRTHRDCFQGIRDLVPKGNWHVEIFSEWSRAWSFEPYIQLVRDLGLEGLKAEDHRLTISPSEHKSEPIGTWAPGARMQVFGTTTTPPVVFPFSMVTGDERSILFSGPRFDEIARFQNSVHDKHHQMLPDVCNIIALDTADFTGEVATLPQRLGQVFSAELNRRVSGLFLVARSVAAGGRTVVRYELEQNPHAMIGVPDALVRALTGEVHIG